MEDLLNYRKAAGIKSKKRGPGRPPEGRPKKSELQRLYMKEGQSVREIAESLNVSKDKVYRALREYGIKRRSPAKRSRLRRYDINTLVEMVERDGPIKTAASLGVSRQTLWEYLRGKRA